MPTEFGVDRTGVASGSSTGGSALTFLRLLESQTGPDYITLLAPALTANWTFTFPANDGDANQVLITNGSGTTSWVTVASLAVDHGSLSGLADDDHSQYALLVGRSSGQIVRGGTAASETLTLRGTSHATVGNIALNDLGGHVILGGGATASELRMLEPSGSGTNYTALKAQAQAANVTYTLPAADATVSGYALKSDAAGTLSWGPAGGVEMKQSITQTAHGFVVGDVLYYSGAVYAKADADAASTAEVVGIVQAVTDANTFTLLYGGYIDTLSGLTAGTVYFLSGTAGAFTATEPSTVGQISKPLLIAVGTTTAYFFNFRGVTVGQASSSFAIDRFSGNGSTTAFTLSAAPTSENNTIVFISGVYQQKDTYSISGTTLTFSTAPPTGTDNIEVCTVGALSIGTPSDGTVTEPKLAAGATLKLGTEQASTSGTSIDFTGIPAGTKTINIMLVGVSTNGTANLLIQLGDAGGIEATGYSHAIALVFGTNSTLTANSTTGFQVTTAIAAASVMHGRITLTLEDSSDFTWVHGSFIGHSDGASAHYSAGSKSLSAELDRVRITTTNGTDTFDAGSINITYK